MKMYTLCCEQKQDKGEKTKLKKVCVSSLFLSGRKVYEDIYYKSENKEFWHHVCVFMLSIKLQSVSVA